MNINHDSLKQLDEIELEIQEASKTTDYFKIEYPLEFFLDIISQEEINKEIHWDTSQQSRFIESLLLNLPVLNLVIYSSMGIDEIDGDPESIFEKTFEVIDGKQRLYTSLNFLNGHLKLEGLEMLSALEGFRFNDIILSRQRRIKRKPVKVTHLAAGSDVSYWHNALAVV
jgi:hypothetical protein